MSPTHTPPGSPEWRLRLIQGTLDGLPSHIATIDEHGVIVATNDAWRRFAAINGARWEQVSEGANYLRTCDEARGSQSDEAADVARGIRDVLAGRRPDYSCEYPCHAPHEQRWFMVSVTPFADASRRAVVAHLPVTERHVAEASGLSGGQRFQRLFEVAPEGLLHFSADGTVAGANRQAERLFGFARGELVGTRITRLVPGHVVDHHVARLAGRGSEPGAAERVGPQRRFVASRRDGSTFLGEMSLSPFESGVHGTLVAVVRDVSDQQRHEDRVRQSQRLDAASQLAGGVAHDFNNLLSIINVAGDLLHESVPEGSPLREDVDAIRSASTKAAALTDRLLTFSRRQVVQPEAVDLGAALERQASAIRQVVGAGVRVAVSAGRGVWPVLADPGQLEQVVLNLAANARDAMPEGGTLDIEVANVPAAKPDAADRVSLVVRDTGTGMDDATRSRVFEPFFTTRRRGSGTGLGLAAVHGIVGAAGGEITCDSALGRGTTFTILLPRAAAPPSSDDATQTATRGDAAPGGATILIVDDEADVRRIAGRVLTRQGYRVLTAASGADAILTVEREHGAIDLVLSDIVMPGMSGWDAVARIREIRPGLRVLFTSGFTDEPEFRRRIAESEIQFLPKPFDVGELIRRVREVLDAEP